MQATVNAAPTPGEGRRVRGLISALVGAGIVGGYLTNARLKEVHWQAGERPVCQPQARLAGETALYVDPDEIPGSADVARLGQAAARGCGSASRTPRSTRPAPPQDGSPPRRPGPGSRRSSACRTRRNRAR
jgi:hypothetical protein